MESSLSLDGRYFIRHMEPADIQQALEVEQEALPTIAPQISLRHEYRKQGVRYLVAVRNESPGQSFILRTIPLNKILRWLWGLPTPKLEDYVVGFIGITRVIDEIHVLTFGVRTDFRKQGIGELLMIAAIDQSIEQGAELITLEVRQSNTAAINLYNKYGFMKKGVRRRYYTDNREDALIMTADRIQYREYQTNFKRRKRGYSLC